MFKTVSETNRKKAFSLAELIIVLGLVGMIANLTLPSLIRDAKETSMVSQVKKAYSVLSRACTMAINESGAPQGWGITAGASAPMLTTITPYLNVVKDCTDGSTGCWPTGIAYRYLSNAEFGIIDEAGYPSIKLTDGSIIYGYGDAATCTNPVGTSAALQSECGRYAVDVNGQRGPNQWGHDLVQFYLTRLGIIPLGTETDNSIYRFDNNCKNSTTQEGRGCTAWILYNENMDYLRCADLAWSTKTECN